MSETFFLRQVQKSDSKIAMVILDGLGGLPRKPGGLTELETAFTPNLDSLAFGSALGLSLPISPGIITGSGPGHLAIFGYDPLEYEIGRGVLEALGVDFELGPDDIAARGNFCSVDEQGILTDRRAGRLATRQSQHLVEQLRNIKVEGAEIFIEAVKEHRFAFILRAAGFGANVTDTDPLKLGVATRAAESRDSMSEKTARAINSFIQQARTILADQSPANMIMLRGFSKFPSVPTFPDKYLLNAAAVAVNGMYRGVARLVGMKVLDVQGSTLADEFSSLEKHWNDHDFFYLHFKKTDTCGENGDFDGKVKAIEEFDSLLPRLLTLGPDVLVVTGDHSSPAIMQSHSWHPVPLLLSSRFVRADAISEFGEKACARGSLGIIPAKNVMLLVLANAGRVAKYGA